jgi:hypothetical protein
VGTLQTVSDAGTAAPQVGVYPKGADFFADASIVWRRFDGTAERIEVLTFTPGGTVRPIVTLSAPGQNADSPQIAVSSIGTAFAVWQSFDGTNTRIQAARDP